MIDADADALARWLGVQTVELQGGPSSGGWSNETVFINADGRPLVVRLAPAGRSMFPSYDLGHQVRVLRYAASAGLPVPEVLGHEVDGAVVGREFFVMSRVEGRVPPDDDPPFTKSGFLFDAGPEAQRAFHDAAIDRIVSIHRVAPPSFVVERLPAEHLAASDALARWCEFMPDITFAAHAQLVQQVPQPDASSFSLLWGDARPANMVVDEGFAVVALLDWELASAGPGELDIAWFCEMNRMRSGGMGIAPLPGFPDEAETWARWSAGAGREPADVAWYHRFAAYRVSVFLQLYLAAMVHRGVIRPGHRVLSDNAGTRRLEELL